MKIAVNTRLLLDGKMEGIGWYAYETLSRMVKAHPEHEFVFLFDRPYANRFLFADNVTAMVVWPPTRHPWLWYYWFEHALPSVLKRLQPDLFLSPDGYLSLKAPTKSLLVIHDLAYEHYPEDVPRSARKFYLKYSPLYAKKADRIVAVSEATKNDIIQQYGIDAGKIDVVYNAVKSAFHPIAAEEKKQVKEKYSGGHDYFLTVCAFQPRKNLSRLFQSFDRFKTETGSDYKLLIAGSKGWQNAPIYRIYEAMQHKSDVVFLDYLEPEALNGVLAAAQVMFYISYFEGFGVPVVEAMQCEVPVVTSNVSSLPEVAGDAALLIDPFDEAAIARSMATIINDSALRTDLIAKGKIQCRKFNWDSSATRLWDSVDKLLS